MAFQITNFITDYTGTVPKRQSDTPIAFAENVYNYLLWIDAHFNPESTLLANDINTAINDINTISQNVFEQAIDGGYSQSAVDSKLSLKENITDNDAKLALKENITDNDAKLALKVNIADNDVKQTKQDDRLNALETSQSAGTIGYATRADLDADLAHNENTIAIITNDTTPSNNGSYIKVGASGSGSWQQSSYDRVAEVENTLIYKADVAVGKNLYNKNTGNDGYFMNNDGDITASANFTYSDYIPVTSGMDYYVNGSRFTTYFNAAKNVVSGGSSSGETNITVPAGVAYIIYTLEGLSKKETSQFELGTSATSYEPYTLSVSLENLQSTIKYIDDENKKQSISKINTENFKSGVNVFPSNRLSYTSNARILSNGDIGTDATYNDRVWDYAELDENTEYHFEPNPANFQVAYYDADFGFISLETNIYQESFTTPTGTKYIRVQEGTVSGDLAIVKGAFVKQDGTPYRSIVNEDSLVDTFTSSKFIPKISSIKNLYSKDTPLTLNSRFGDYGQVSTNPSFTSAVTDFIEVNTTETTYSVSSSGYSIDVVQYDSEKRFISRITAYNATYDLNPLCKYLRLQVSPDNGYWEYCITLGDTIPDDFNQYNYTIEENMLPYKKQGILMVDKYYGLTGKNVEIYHNHLMKNQFKKSPFKLYNINNNNRAGVFNSSTPTTKSVVAKLYDEDMQLTESKTVSIEVSDITKDNGAINLIAIGDSYTSAGQWTSVLESTIPNVTSVGLVQGHPALVPTVHTEGRAGWMLTQYFDVIHSPAEWPGFSPFMHPSISKIYYGCTKHMKYLLANDSTLDMGDTVRAIGFDATTGFKTTPSVDDCMYDYDNSQYVYWDGSAWTAIDEATLDFQFNISKYRSTWGIAQADVAVIMMGINDFANITMKYYERDLSTKTGYYWDDCELMIASLKADNPNIKISVNIPNNVFSELDSTDGNFIEYKQDRMNRTKEDLISLYSGRESENIYLVDSPSSLDSVYGIGEISNEPPFEEYTGSETIKVVNDPIHPNGYGYASLANHIAGWIQYIR